MRIEDIAINLRVRRPYEALDLGYIMVMTWWRSIYLAWLCFYLPVACVLLLICYAMPTLALVLLWWLRPLFDRVILHVLSAAAFGAAPSPSAVWRALPSIVKNSGLLWSLTIGRVDLARSFSLPARLLERQKGSALRQRQEVLNSVGRSTGVWLTIVSMHFELLLLLSIYFFVSMFLPEGSGAFDMERLLLSGKLALSLQYLTAIISMLAFLLLEPLYVGAGFALYLNTRTLLEGWDIELVFKRMHKRLSEKQAITMKSASAVKLFVALLMPAMLMTVMAMHASSVYAIPQSSTPTTDTSSSSPSSSQADAPAPTCSAPSVDATSTTATIASEEAAIETPQAAVATTPQTGAAKRANEVLSHPDFGYNKKGWELKYVGPGADRKPKKNPDYAWIELIGKFLGYFLRYFAWLAAIIAVGALLYWIVKQWASGRWWRGTHGNAPMPETLFGLDVRPESLPADIVAEARLHLQRGDLRGALSLLYRGALVYLLKDGKLEISPGDTEGVCVRRVWTQYRGYASMKNMPPYFESLVRVWQRVAYGGISRNSQSASGMLAIHDDVLRLIDEWAQVFGVIQAVQDVNSDDNGHAAKGAA
jgi:hypothetical protein